MPANDQVIKLIMQMLGTDDVRAAIAALQDLQDQGPATASALGQAEAATKQVSDATKEAAASTKALEAEEREALQQMKAAEAAANALAAANAKVNALFDADKATADAARMADANRAAADAAEMLAAAERHAAEMEAFAAAESAKLASALAAQRAADAAAESATYELADAYEVLGNEQTAVFTTASQIGSGMRSAAAAASTTASTVGGAATAVGSLGKAGTDADKGAQQARQGMLDVSRAAQDFIQGGFGGIINNLEGLGRGVPAIGNNLKAAFTTLPAILTLVGTAAYVALPYIKDFLASFDPGKATGFKDSLDELQKTIKGLLEKQGITLVDLANLDNAQRQLDDLKASQAAFNALKGAQTNLQEKVGKAVKDVVIEEAGGTDEEAGVENLARLIEAGRVKRGEFLAGPENVGDVAQLDRLRRRRDEARAMQEGGTPEMVETGMRLEAVAEGRIKALETQMTDAARKAIRGMIGDASRGINVAREAIIDEFDKAPDLFKTGGGVGQGVGAGFRGKLELASAENIKAQQEFDKANKREIELAKQQQEDAKKAADAQKKADAERAKKEAQSRKELVDQLNKQGAEGEKEALAERAANVKDEATRRAGVAKQRGVATKEGAATFEQSVQASGIADFAGARLARAQAAGGMPDRFGRLQKMDPGQIEAAVRKQVEAWLHRQVDVDQRGRKVFANPQMGGEETGLVASRIVTDAQKGVNSQVNSLAGTNLKNTGRLLAVAQQFEGKLRQQDQQINGMQMQADAQSRAINALRVDVTPRAHHNRRHGQP